MLGFDGWKSWQMMDNVRLLGFEDGRAEQMKDSIRF
jgi:hypothetical protein